MKRNLLITYLIFLIPALVAGRTRAVTPRTTRQITMKTATMGFIVLASILVAPHTFGAASVDRPNVILIYTDDHGYTDLGVLGIDKHVDTPNMDKLARGGALMTAGYSSAPQCQPSRAGLMAGRIQNEFAFPHNACDAGEGKGRMPRTYPKGTDMAGQPVLTIADRMKKLGYVTGFSGKWHLGPPNSRKPKHDPRGGTPTSKTCQLSSTTSAPAAFSLATISAYCSRNFSAGVGAMRPPVTRLLAQSLLWICRKTTVGFSSIA